MKSGETVLNHSGVAVGALRFDPETLVLSDRDGQRVKLRNKSAEVLACLSARRGEVVSKTELLDAVWTDVTVTDESLKQCIADIRRAIGDTDQTIIRTEVGKGYCLNASGNGQKPMSQKLAAGAVAGILSLSIVALAVWYFWTDRPSDRPTRVAVLAFDDLGPEDENGYLGDGISEGIITELARYPELAVIARNSSFSFRDKATEITEIARQLRADFVIEGSVQKSGDRLKVTVQLINGQSGTHHWAHEFKETVDDYFDVQSKIVLGVASHLGRELAWFEPESGGPEKSSALDYYLRGNSEFWKPGAASKFKARELYLKAIEADPEAPYGYIGMSLVVYTDIPSRIIYQDMPRDELLALGTEFAEKALALDPDYYAAHIARGDMHDRAGEHELAIIRYQNAAKLNPSSADAMVLASEPLLFLGREDEAIETLRRAIDISPIPPEWYYKSLSFALWAKGECEEAVKWSLKRAQPKPWDLRHLMVAQACSGDLEGARQTAARHEEAVPGFTVQTYRERNSVSYKSNPALLERFLDDLAKAGLPES